MLPGMYRLRVRRGFALAIPGGHEQYFVTGGIPEYVVDMSHAIDFEETEVTGVRPVRQASGHQKEQFGELFRPVFSKVFDHYRQLLHLGDFASSSAASRISSLIGDGAHHTANSSPGL
jgi:hypothetical protein